MSSKENKLLARRSSEAGSSDNLDACEELFGPDVVLHNFPPEQAPTLERFKRLEGD